MYCFGTFVIGLAAYSLCFLNNAALAIFMGTCEEILMLFTCIWLCGSIALFALQSFITYYILIEVYPK